MDAWWNLLLYTLSVFAIIMLFLTFIVARLWWQEHKRIRRLK